MSRSFLPGGPGIQEIFHPQLNSLQTDRRATKPVHHTHNQHAPSTRTRDVTSYMEEPVQDLRVWYTTQRLQRGMHHPSLSSELNLEVQRQIGSHFAHNFCEISTLPRCNTYLPEDHTSSSSFFPPTIPGATKLCHILAFWGWYKLTLYL